MMYDSFLGHWHRVIMGQTYLEAYMKPQKCMIESTSNVYFITSECHVQVDVQYHGNNSSCSAVFHRALVYVDICCNGKNHVTPFPDHAFRITIYASVVSLALPFVTLTPSCFALETISARFLEETACAILMTVST